MSCRCTGCYPRHCAVVAGTENILKLTNTALFTEESQWLTKRSIDFGGIPRQIVVANWMALTAGPWIPINMVNKRFHPAILTLKKKITSLTVMLITSRRVYSSLVILNGRDQNRSTQGQCVKVSGS